MVNLILNENIDLEKVKWMDLTEFPLTKCQLDKDSGSDYNYIEARDDSKNIVGFISYAETSKRIAHIYSFEIKESLRCTHLGKIMLSRLVSLLKCKGFTNITLHVLNNDPKLVKFYKDCMFTKSMDNGMILMSCSLKPVLS